MMLTALQKFPNARPLQSPVKGQLIWQYDVADDSSAPNIGESVKEGRLYVCTGYYGLELAKALRGKIVYIGAKQGEAIEKGDHCLLNNYPDYPLNWMFAECATTEFQLRQIINIKVIRAILQKHLSVYSLLIRV